MISNEVRGLAFALERVDLHVVDEHRAILALVAHQRAHRLGVAQGFAQCDQFRLVAIFTLQQPQVLAEELSAGRNR